MTGHALPGAGEAQALFRGGLHIDLLRVQSQSVSNVFLHLGDVAPQLRPLGDHGHIHVAHLVSRPVQLLPHKGQELPGRNSLVPGVRIGKMLADVPQTGGPPEGVHHRMQQDVCIGMALQAQLEGNLHPA